MGYVVNVQATGLRLTSNLPVTSSDSILTTETTETRGVSCVVFAHFALSTGLHCRRIDSLHSRRLTTSIHPLFSLPLERHSSHLSPSVTRFLVFCHLVSHPRLFSHPVSLSPTPNLLQFYIHHVPSYLIPFHPAPPHPAPPHPTFLTNTSETWGGCLHSPSIRWKRRNRRGCRRRERRRCRRREMGVTPGRKRLERGQGNRFGSRATGSGRFDPRVVSSESTVRPSRAGRCRPRADGRRRSSGGDGDGRRRSAPSRCRADPCPRVWSSSARRSPC